MRNGILWIVRTGAPWADLPDRYPPYQTCYRRFQQWVRLGVLRSILEVLAQALLDEGYLDLNEVELFTRPPPSPRRLTSHQRLGLGSMLGQTVRRSHDRTPDNF